MLDSTAIGSRRRGPAGWRHAACWIALGLLTCSLPAAALGPQREHKQTPEQAGMAYAETVFETSDGLELRGWFLPAQGRDGAARVSRRPIVVMPAPEVGNCGDLLWHYYHFLRGTPWHVLMFDWRGYGASADWGIDEELVVLPEFLLDLQAAIDHARSRPEWDGEHIGIVAFDMGAAVSLAVAQERDDVSCMLLRGLYTSQHDLVATAEELAAKQEASSASAEAAATVTVPRVNETFPAELEPLAVASAVSVPVLLIAGAEDPVTPPEMATEIAKQLGAYGELWVAPGAGHGGDMLPEAVHPQEFGRRMATFFARHLPTGRR